MINTQVCIIGAGPGGVAAALKLDKLGIPCILVDKSVFPRGKVCGDGISGKVPYAFNKIDKSIMLNFYKKKDLYLASWGAKFVFSKSKEFIVKVFPDLEKRDLENCKPQAFSAQRIDFDNYLVDIAREKENITFIEGLEINDYCRENSYVILKDKNANCIVRTEILILANGSQSRFTKKLIRFDAPPRYYLTSVLGYFKNVGGLDKYNFVELHYLKEINHGYLWIFPMQNGLVNVGLGASREEINKNNINLKETFFDILKNDPRFATRFEKSEMIGGIRAKGYNVFSKRQKLSGDNFMLVGDAASLADPLTGEGIGNAVLSGIQAALQANECLKKEEISAKYMANYDKNVFNEIGKELKISLNIRKLFQKNWRLKIIVAICHRNKSFIELLTKMVTNLNERKKLGNPLLYLRLLLKKK
ncbi:NAD(P)/FAD-dependent oxidoreductase [Bacteroidota bacterium]